MTVREGRERTKAGRAPERRACPLRPPARGLCAAPVLPSIVYYAGSLSPAIPTVPHRCGSGEWFPVFSYALETAILGAASPQAALSAASGKGRDEVCESCDFFDFGANAHSSASGTSNISLSGVTPVLSTACAAYPRACEGQDIIVLDADRSLDFNSQVAHALPRGAQSRRPCVRGPANIIG